MATTVAGVELLGPVEGRFEEVLTEDALAFVAELHRRFDGHRRELLERRRERMRALRDGGTLDFLPETREIRDGEWQVAPPPPDLQNRRVEITGPTDRKMVINALNSGAKVFMADFEDANSPTWANCVAGQVNLVDAVRRELVEEGFVLRYRPEADGGVDGLPGGEGAFLACSFWLANALHGTGRPDEAKELFERLLGLRNDLGILSEEYDVGTHRQVGNTPQAFSHVGLVNTARHLSGTHPAKEAT